MLLVFGGILNHMPQDPVTKSIVLPDLRLEHLHSLLEFPVLDPESRHAVAKFDGKEFDELVHLGHTALTDVCASGNVGCFHL